MQLAGVARQASRRYYGAFVLTIPGVSMATDDQEREPRWLTPAVCVTVAVLWLALGFLPIVAQHGFSLQWGTEHAGEFGDSFGFVNSLFSGLAFAFVVLALHYQRKELALQRQELEETRKELARSADAQDQTQSALNLQSYLNACNTLAAGWAADEVAQDEHSAIKFATHQRKLTLLYLQDVFYRLHRGEKLGAAAFDSNSAIKYRLYLIGRSAQARSEGYGHSGSEELKRIAADIRGEIRWLIRIVYPAPGMIDKLREYEGAGPKTRPDGGIKHEEFSAELKEYYLRLIRENAPRDWDRY